MLTKSELLDRIAKILLKREVLEGDKPRGFSRKKVANIEPSPDRSTCCSGSTGHRVSGPPRA